MTKQPNFLYIMCDQLRADWLGCTGHPVVKTPNIDALAAAGTLFTDFHAASPVCMPNRASFMTGRMPSLHGLRYNGCHLPTTANTFVDSLAAAGYDTASIGKSHLQPFTKDPARHKSEPDKPHPTPIAEAWNIQFAHSAEEPKNYTGSDPYDVARPYFGFQHVEIASRHGDRCGGHYEQWFRAHANDPDALWDPANELPHTYTCPQAYRTPVPEELYPTTWIADRAIDYLHQPQRADTPFFAYVSFADPHHPFNPPGKYWDMYSPDDFDVTLPFGAHQSPSRPMEHAKAQFEAGQTPPTLQTMFMATDQHIREAMALTAGMLTMIDDQVGRLVQALKETGQYDNTVIVFNSDHGDYMGDFNMLLKGALPFRSITQVPLIWSDPQSRTARRTEAMATTIDLPATILDRANLGPFNGMQGRSFLQSLFSDAPHRTEIFIEYNDNMARLGFEQPARVRSLSDKAWRFTLYGGEDWGELYDLRNDPNETRNLWTCPDHAATKAEMSLRLNHQLCAQMDESPLSDRLA